MIEIPIYKSSGDQVGSLQIDEQALGGEVRPALLKQAFVRYHANARQGTVKTKKRSEVAYSTRKLYKQKGTGNARRGSAGANILRHGGHGHSKKPHSWRQDMPRKMRRLANRNAILAKVIDGELKIIDSLAFEKPSTKQFGSLLGNLKIDRSCLVALSCTTDAIAKSARNLDNVSVTQIDRLNAFDLLNHRYVLAEKAALEGYLARITDELANAKLEEAV